MRLIWFFQDLFIIVFLRHWRMLFTIQIFLPALWRKQALEWLHFWKMEPKRKIWLPRWKASVSVSRIIILILCEDFSLISSTVPENFSGADFVNQYSKWRWSRTSKFPGLKYDPNHSGEWLFSYYKQFDHFSVIFRNFENWCTTTLSK